MTRGENPKHEFTLPFTVETVSSIRAIYSQNGKPVFKKETEDFSLDGNVATVQLTQEETLKFRAEEIVEIQLRVLTVDGDSLASDIIQRYAKRLLEDEVLT